MTIVLTHSLLQNESCEIMSSLAIIAGLVVAMAGAAQAQNFRVIGSIYTGTPGEIYTYRAWYGDGNMYIGPHVPASIENPLNFTSESTMTID